MSTVTIAQTDTPSRSKMAGPCWIRVNGPDRQHDVYASTKPREIAGDDGQPLAAGETITAEGRIKVRRVTRNEELRAEWKLAVTGNPEDSVTLTVTPCGQTVTAVVTGVVLADGA